jgi:hypothetical protein
MSRFKSFANLFRSAPLKVSNSLLGENKDLPDKYFKEKTLRPKDIKNKPIADQEVVKKQEVVLEPLSLLTEKQEPIVDQKMVEKQEAILEPLSMLAEKQEPIADQKMVEKEEAVSEPLSMLTEKQQPVTGIMDYSVLINKESIIPCPVCHIPIPFNAQGLLAGILFSCPSCSASVGLSRESKPIVEETINKLEELKINKL